MIDPYILVAPTGARRGHADHPALPLSTSDIVQTAQEGLKAGAHGLHLHIRDDQGVHSLDAGRYLEAITELTIAAPKLEVQITTEAAGLFDVQTQFDCLKNVKPAWASISVREIARSPEMIDRVYGLCAEQGTRVQHILYDADDVAQLNLWQNRGLVRHDQVERLLVLGRYTSNQQSRPEDLDHFPRDASAWMVCAFGTQEHSVLLRAAELGADVRVGFENSLTNSDGRPWTDNAASVAALVADLKGKAK